MKKILITGLHGLLARHFIMAFSSDYEIYITGHRNLDLGIPNVRVVDLDFSQIWSTSTLPKKIDAVIHLAQSSNYRAFPNKSLDIYQVNVDSTARLLDYAVSSGAASFIFASTGGLYPGGDKPCNEESQLLPFSKLNYHFSSKLASEILAWPYSSLMNIVILRPFFIYGKGQRRSMLIPRIFDMVRAGRPITIQGDHGILTNPIHAKDAAQALSASLTLGDSGIYNIAGPTTYSIRKICEAMGEYLGTGVKFECKLEQTYNLIADITKMKSELHIPKHDLLESFHDITI